MTSTQHIYKRIIYSTYKECFIYLVRHGWVNKIITVKLVSSRKIYLTMTLLKGFAVIV